MLAIFKYLSMMRDSEFPAWYQREMSIIKATRFRFQEKRRPDDYAVWVSEHLSWPVPRELVLSAPQLVWEWDEQVPAGGGEREMRDVLESLRVDRGRVVLMAKGAEHERLRGKGNWEQEPWYGTQYRVETLDEAFVQEVCMPRVANGVRVLRQHRGSRRPKVRTTFLSSFSPARTSSSRPT